MATYSFSALSNGQAISFNPNGDVLNFDQTAISAGNLSVDLQGTDTRITVLSGIDAGKSITLLSTMPPQLATSNVHFANGSALLFGDNSPSTAGDDLNNVISATNGADLIKGFGGNDAISAGEGADSIIGGAGNDTIYGDGGNDWIEGGAGNDLVSGSGDQDSIVFREFGAANADTVSGFASDWDNIQLDIAAFTQVGANGRFAPGDARFYAAPGATAGHDADDRIIYNTTTGQLFYDADGNGPGAAQLIATLDGAPALLATDINVFGNAAPPPPPPSDQTINGTAGNDSLVGGAGNDTINGLGGDDTLIGLAGNDSLSGGDGNDSLGGGDGNDTLDGGAGVDTLDGGLGNDTYIVTGGDQVTDSGGTDTVIAVNTSWDLGLGSGLENLTLRGDPTNGDWGGSGNELNNVIRDERAPATNSGLAFLNGGGGDDTLIGNGASEVFQFGANYGNESVVGGGGGDRLVFNGVPSTPAIFANFITGTVLGGGGTVTFTGIGRIEATNSDDHIIGGLTDLVAFGLGGNDTLEGGAGNDLLVGDEGPDFLGGFVGNDLLTGGAGNDQLLGGRGADTLDGGTGNDTLRGETADSLAGGTYADSFVFDVQPGAANADTIVDFQSGADQIHLDARVMSALGTTGTFAPGDARFYAAPGATSGHDADDRVIYDTSTGNLYYDADGSGAGAGQLIATVLNNRPAAPLVASDIIVDNGTSGGGGGGGTPPPPPPGSRVGTEGNDTLIGTAGADTIYGLGGNDFIGGGEGADSIVAGAGNDTIYGDGGNDWIEGGAGNDLVSGSGDQDSIVFREFGAANADTVSGFASDWDNLQFDAASFSAIGASGRFAAGDARFYAAAGATSGHDADDRLIYNTSTGQLFYDADGNGSGAAQLIATLEGAPPLVASDINVFGNASPPPPPPNTINGTAGNDSLVGGPDSDTINGLEGDDTLIGGPYDPFIPEGGDRLDGGPGNDYLFGGRGADLYIGGDGNDTLDGDGANFGHNEVEADTMDGGLGDDLFIVDNPNDVLTDAGGVDTVRAVNMNFTLPAGFENLIIYNDEIETRQQGIGNELNNVLGRVGGSGWHVYLDGQGGNDTMYGSPQEDILIGGLGNDVLTGYSDPDVFLFNVAPGAANADVITDMTIDDDIQLDGTAFTNAGFNGRFATNDARFYAAAGATGGHDADDRIVYNTTTGELFYDADGNGAGAAQLFATLQGAPALVARQIVIVNAPGLVINGTPGNDSLVGTTSNDTLNGLGGNDTLDGGVGADSLVGGDGNDVYLVDDARDAVVEAQAGGVDELRTSLSSYTLPDSVENLTLVGGAFLGYGNALNNVMRTSDTQHGELHGGAGDDTLIAGAAGGSLYGEGGNDQLTGSNLADSFLGGTGDDTILAGGGDDQIYTYFDSTTGSTFGHDVIDGGPGIDWFAFDSSQSAATVDLAAGTASNAQGSATLSNIEYVVGTNGNDWLTGNSVDNRLIGGLGSDTLNGGAGNDMLIGGEDRQGVPSADTFVLSDAPGVANADNLYDFATGSDTIQLDARVMGALGAAGRFSTNDVRFFAAAGATGGHDADDRIIYNTSTGELFYDADGSGAGGAQLIATLGAIPVGGTHPTNPLPLAATDILVVDAAPTGQMLNGTAGNDSLVGGPGNDTINGLAGNDTIDGGPGADSMVGGPGDDLYFVDNPGDVIVEQNLEGFDEVRSTASSYTLPDWVNNLTLLGPAVTGSGNSIENVISASGVTHAVQLDGYFGNDTLIGGSGNDELNGWQGNDSMVGGDGDDLFDAFSHPRDGIDTMDGGAGNDTYYVNTGDVIIDSSGTDTVVTDASWTLAAGLENLTFSSFGDDHDIPGLVGTGNDAANVIDGRAGGGVVLDGRAGNDTLIGSAGADSFLFTVAPGASNADQINGFASGADKIHLDGNAMTAIGPSGTFAAGDARFYAAAGANVGHDADDRVVYNVTTGQLWYDADGSGGGAAQLIATLQGAPTLAATDIAVDNGSSAPPPPPPGGIVGTNGNDTMPGTAGNDSMFGLGGNDVIAGGGGADSMVGGAGNDTIYGDFGNDWIEGGAGNDSLSGGGDQDSYVFRESGAANADTIGDFGSGWDALRFDASAFSTIGAAGHFAAGDARFYAAAGASAGHDADDRIVYNTTTGQLFYDADGSGGGAAQLVATIQGAPGVAAGDIWVI